jgi:hypothetical protein
MLKNQVKFQIQALPFQDFIDFAIQLEPSQYFRGLILQLLPSQYLKIAAVGAGEKNSDLSIRPAVSLSQRSLPPVNPTGISYCGSRICIDYP